MGMTEMGVTNEALQEQLKAVFAHEAAGSLARVESLLDRPAPDGRDLVEALFREFHTMKVGAAAAGYNHAARALHDAESLLDAFRGPGAGLRAPDEWHALRRLVERVRGEFSDDTPVGDEDAVTLRALWPLLARATATAAADEGKLVALDLGGGSVVLEGAIGAVLRGSLLHLVRNAVAHGIEPPAERHAAGKPRVGRVLVSGLREPARLCIAVTDDGRGLDRAAIAAAARRAGVTGRAEDVVLQSGLSTRASADTLAGRGVGLDAVACALREIGGQIAIQSRDGQGCTVQLEIPATDRPAVAVSAPAPASSERRHRRGRRR